MSKVKIELVSIGHLPLEFQADKILNWKSSLFEVTSEIENYALRCDSDGQNWEFSDVLVKTQLPQTFSADFMIALVNVPIQSNWYSRRLGNNQIIFTFFEIKEIMEQHHIPIENVILRLLYAYTFIYKRHENKIPTFEEVTNFTHDETRGCLFDMNGIKVDLVASSHNPIICDECRERLRKEKVSKKDIETAQKEIKKIQRDFYYRILGNVKKYPVLALIISSFFALSLGIIGSVIGSVIFTNYLTK